MSARPPARAHTLYSCNVRGTTDTLRRGGGTLSLQTSTVYQTTTLRISSSKEERPSTHSLASTAVEPKKPSVL